MKGYTAASAPSSKRRWKGLALAVIVLVFFSLLVPLVFLVGVQNRFPYGYLTDESSTPDSSFRRFEEPISFHDQNPEEEGKTKIVHNLMRRFGPSISKDVVKRQKGANGNSQIEHIGNDGTSEKMISSETSGESDEAGSTSEVAKQEQLLSSNEKMSNPVWRLKSKDLVKRGVEIVKPCQLEFGSYCLWSMEHKEEMKDSLVKELKDQLFMARSYYPTIAKRRSLEKFSHEMKQNIQDYERMLSEAVVDADLPVHVENKIWRMKDTIDRAKSYHVECGNVDKKLRQILDMTEDEAHFHRRQSAFLYHLGVQTMPKSLHCLSLRLTVEYFKSRPLDDEHAQLERLVNPALQHYVIFSKNILASSVAVNSTVMNCRESGNLVFHLLTDSENYFSLKLWFSKNTYKNAVIHVQNIEDYLLENVDKLGIHTDLSFSEEFRISIRSVNLSSSVNTRTTYFSVFSQAYFLLPDLFKELKRIIVLDDDVVVQQDLSPLWSIDLKGKVKGLVEFCDVRLLHLKSYFPEENYDKDKCLWMSGLGVVDLDMWRYHNITGTYHQLLQEHIEQPKQTQTSWRVVAAAKSILAFQGHVVALNGSWALSGLGTNYRVGADAIKNAAVLHYNGNMKPWLELGIQKYKTYWRNFLTRHNQFMDECNVNP